MKIKHTLAALVLTVCVFACARDPEGHRDDHPQSGLSPQEGPDKEYPGSKYNDSLWQEKKDSVNNMK